MNITLTHCIRCILFTTLATYLYSIQINITRAEEPTQYTQLSDYAWKNRIVLTTSDNATQTTHILQRLNSLKDEINDYQLKVFIIENNTVIDAGNGLTKSSPSVTEIRQRLGDWHTVLIGLDTGTKQQLTDLNLEKVFLAIERMPMRRLQN